MATLSVIRLWVLREQMSVRETAGGEAARAFAPGEGNPKPDAVSRLPRAERRAERNAKRGELKAENKAGALPSYGNSYGSSQRQ
ncbi:hypothetical protein ACSFBX_10280 [Variovorax sp. RB2P76]|uniref:hypothetical protein n=1 Tax=Variovorax sp. RB2P76 TaxID=3443736 RepID=UPI003F460597